PWPWTRGAVRWTARVRLTASVPATGRARAAWTTAARASFGVRRLVEQGGHQRAIGGRVPERGADDLLADHTIASDDERLGHAGRLVRLGDGALGIVQHLEGQAVMMHEIADGLRLGRVIDAHRHNVQPARSH